MSVQCRTMVSQRPCKSVECERPECNPGKAVKVPQRIIDIVTDRGIPFRVVYGKRAYRDGTVSPYEVVAFYDARYDFTEHGQFVSDYNPETMLERERGYGLNLDGGVPNWTVDAGAMDLVRSWLVHQVLAR